MSYEAGRPSGRSSLDTLLAVIGVGLAVGFIVAFSARPAAILSGAAMDDALFIQLGRSLASGHWLGPYNHRILAKGMGFPAFLAIANVFSVPFLLALALFHTACAGFAAHVTRRVLDSRIAGIALFALLLLAPSFYFGDLMRVFRDFFFMSLTTALVASAIALVTGRGLPRWAAAVLTGLLGGWWWLTREEGVWLLPSLALLLLIPLVAPRDGRPAPFKARLRGLAPFAAAPAIAAGIVVAVGLVNWAVYGAFVVNEIKDAAFQEAIGKLQAAAAPYARDKVPVPAAARARIYAVSPAFATLKTPMLDGPLSERLAADGCGAEPKSCGDFGGGWFLWIFREAAAFSGQHASPAKARAFYRRVADEVDRACDDRRLECIDWNVPLAPPMRADQLDDVAASMRRVVDPLTFGVPVWTSGMVSDLSAADADAQVAFLDRPATEGGKVRWRFDGWFAEKGALWFEVVPNPQVEVVKFERRDSPDIANAFKDPGMGRQRFGLEVVCATPACPADLKLEDGRTVRTDLGTLAVGPRMFPPAELYIDIAASSASETFLKTRFSKAWMAFATHLNPLYRGLVVLGVLAYLVMLAGAAVARRLSVPTIVCTALLAGVGARWVLISLIDALSFPAANEVYVLSAIPLLLMFVVYALSEVVRAAVRRRGRAAGPARPPGPPPAAPAH